MFKRLLIATAPTIALAALIVAEASAGNVNQHAQLLGRRFA